MNGKKKKKKGDTFWNIERISYIRRIFVNSSDLIFYHVFFLCLFQSTFDPTKVMLYTLNFFLFCLNVSFNSGFKRFKFTKNN